MVTSKGWVTVHVIKDASPERGIFCFILWRNSYPNMVFVLFICFGNVDLIKIIYCDFNIPVYYMYVDD